MVAKVANVKQKAEASKIIDLLNELNDKDLGQIADYARVLDDSRKYKG